MKAKGTILNYGIELVEQLDNMPKIVVNFEFSEKDDNIKYNSMKWDGFFVKRDGSLNEKTMKALVEMGFTGEDPIVLAEGTGLDIEHEYFIEVEINDKGYPQIQWINRKEGGGVQEIKKAASGVLEKKLADLKIKGAFRKYIQDKKKSDDVPNMFNEKEGIPF